MAVESINKKPRSVSGALVFCHPQTLFYYCHVRPFFLTVIFGFFFLYVMFGLAPNIQKTQGRTSRYIHRKQRASTKIRAAASVAVKLATACHIRA